MPRKKNKAKDNTPEVPVEENGIEPNLPEALASGETEASLTEDSGGNIFLKKMLDSNFIEYASYVIKERAIPDVDDGLKPVQRRILWSLFKMDDGKFHKVANVIGHTMQFHPHGDASIGDALVVLANKEYYIDKQGNFGNIFTGDGASAARYIECRLTPLAREVLFNANITEFIDSYDGRNKEPIRLPVKIPSLLMLGSDGIAVGMATHILPHNFKELLEAQIAILKGENFRIYPDFLQGGLMDVSEYEDGNGKVTLRSRIDIDGRKLIIREIPATTTTENLIASIERAVEKNKIKIATINDFTTDKIEIEIVPMRGQEPEKALKALYAYTDCSVSVNVNMMLICENRPVHMSVSEVLHRNTEKLLEYLKLELELELASLHERFHEKTLVQIFIENRIYKRIEKSSTYENVLSEIRSGLEKFRDMLQRDISDEDIEKLLTLQIRRISLFDIKKNKKEIDDIIAHITEVEKHLKRLKAYAVSYLKALIDKYAAAFPRKTEIEKFEKIDRHSVALNNIKVGWDRKNCYIGTNVKSDEQVTCNEYDHLLCIERNGDYKVINIPEKIFCDRLFDFRKYDKDTIFGIVYSEKKTGKIFAKRTVISKFITDKEYKLCPEGCRLEVVTPRPTSIYDCIVDAKRNGTFEIDLSQVAERSPKARGELISKYKLVKITFSRLQDGPADDDGTDNDNTPVPETETENTEITDSSPSQEAQPDLIPTEKSEAPVLPEKKKRSPQKKSDAKKAKSYVDDEDWGISQPELEF
ncbi:MAG: hypothetical protein A2020_06110 [Lentisphaerae bacterium GWF2_45_14]|nr:MAG: hypothetical protein A2020_06110 [Lentisphaerae bacterium GWF2_45_14]